MAEVRSLVDTQRSKLSERLVAGAIDEYRAASIHLADGAVVGLCHLARICVGRGANTIVAPFAAVAVGSYGLRQLDSKLELLFLLSDDPGA
jgi:hypothetical protein